MNMYLLYIKATFNLPKNKRIITETYDSGNLHCNIYSDGWCEQYGITTVASNGNISGFLYKKYKENLEAVISLIKDSHVSSSGYINWASISVTGGYDLRLWNYISGQQDISWCAYGYISEYKSQWDIIKY